MEIKIQSFVDIITNSSTTIYQYVNEDAVEWLYDVIQAIMDSDEDINWHKTSRDLYDIYVAGYDGDEILVIKPKIEDENIKKVSDLLNKINEIFHCEAIIDN